MDEDATDAAWAQQQQEESERFASARIAQDQLRDLMCEFAAMRAKFDELFRRSFSQP